MKFLLFALQMMDVAFCFSSGIVLNSVFNKHYYDYMFDEFRPHEKLN